jgi:hypothetical protein
MAWVGKVFNPRPEPSKTLPKSFASSARYQAGLMDLDELGARMRRQGAQVGMDRAEQWVALTDGGNGLDDFITSVRNIITNYVPAAYCMQGCLK